MFHFARGKTLPLRTFISSSQTGLVLFKIQQRALLFHRKTTNITILILFSSKFMFFLFLNISRRGSFEASLAQCPLSFGSSAASLKLLERHLWCVSHFSDFIFLFWRLVPSCFRYGSLSFSLSLKGISRVLDLVEILSPPTLRHPAFFFSVCLR